MIYIDSLSYTAASKIRITMNEQPLNISFHSRCLTNYITLNKDIALLLNNTDNTVYKFPSALQIPIYMRKLTAKILFEDHKFFILIGAGGIHVYFHHPLN